MLTALELYLLDSVQLEDCLLLCSQSANVFTVRWGNHVLCLWLQSSNQHHLATPLGAFDIDQHAPFSPLCSVLPA